MRIAPAKPLFIARCFLNFSGKHSLRSATITRRLTSITKTYPASGFEVPPSSSHHFVVNKTLKGIRRSIGTAQEGKAPLLTSDIRRIVACCHQTLSGLPDQALVLVGFAGNVSERDIMRQTGQKSLDMLARYIRIGEMFTRNATGLGIEPIRKRASQSFRLLKQTIPFSTYPNRTMAPKPIRRAP